MYFNTNPTNRPKDPLVREVPHKYPLRGNTGCCLVMLLFKKTHIFCLLETVGVVSWGLGGGGLSNQNCLPKPEFD